MPLTPSDMKMIKSQSQSKGSNKTRGETPPSPLRHTPDDALLPGHTVQLLDGSPDNVVNRNQTHVSAVDLLAPSPRTDEKLKGKQKETSNMPVSPNPKVYQINSGPGSANTGLDKSGEGRIKVEPFALQGGDSENDELMRRFKRNMVDILPSLILVTTGVALGMMLTKR